MADTPTVVVAGLPGVVAGLRSTGRFPTLFEAGDIEQLMQLFAVPEVKDCPARQLVFLFADTLPQAGSPFPLTEVVRRLTANHYSVAVVGLSAAGSQIVQQQPQATLLATPLRPNDLLYAFNAFGHTVDPVDVGDQPFDPTDPSTSFTAPAAADVAAPALDGWAAPEPLAASPQPDGQSQQGAPPQPDQQQPDQQPDQQPAAQPQQWAPPQPDRQQPGQQPGQQPHAFAPPADQQPVAQPQQWAPPQPDQQQPGQQPGQQPHAFAPPADQQPVPQPDQQQPGQQPHAFAPPLLNHNPSQGTSTEGVTTRVGAYTAQPPAGQRRGHVMPISVAAGGTGKSTLTLNLAAFLGMRLRAQGKTVCVVDANYQQADAGKYLDVYTPNINTLANNPSMLTRERITEALVHKPEYNLSVLLGPATVDEGNPLSIDPRLYREIVDLLKEHYDYILIDTPVAEKYHDLFQKFALPVADYLIVPVIPSYQKLQDADNWLRAAVTAPVHANGAGIDPDRIGVMLNRAEDGIDCSEEDVRRTMASWNFVGAIPETKEWKRSNSRHELVAPKNYAELSQAFAEVLHAATGEPVLLENFNLAESSNGRRGLLARIKGAFT